MIRTLLIYILLFGSVSVFSQRAKQNAKFTIRGNIGIPKTISSKMFSTAFSGVYEGNLSVNVRAFTNFFVGLGYQNSHFVNNKKIFDFYQFKDADGTAHVYNTQLDGHSGFLKLGYDHFLEKAYFSFCLNVGVMVFNYQKVNLDTSIANRPYPPTTFNSPYLQPEVAVNFLTDGNLSFSIMFGYSTVLYRFDPKAPRFNHFGEINSKSNSYFMSWLNIGFGFNILIGKK